MIVLSSPTAQKATTRAKTTIRGVAADDQGIARLRIRLNGEELADSAGDKAIGVAGRSRPAAEREVEFAVAARLTPGVNEIEITAWDTDGLVETKSRTVIFEEPTGKVHLVSIGINAYQHVRPRHYHRLGGERSEPGRSPIRPRRFYLLSPSRPQRGRRRRRRRQR